MNKIHRLIEHTEFMYYCEVYNLGGSFTQPRQSELGRVICTIMDIKL